MVNELQNTDLVDPLCDYSTLSLFPRTFRDSKNAAKLEEQDIESIHSFLKSMALRSPKKLLDQAMTIVNRGSELMNSMLPSNVEAGNKEDAAAAAAAAVVAAAKGSDRPQERRPALGRKRARFALKPNSSQPSVIMEPNLDIDRLQDPEEYFLAHEKLENAKKELQRQRGDVLMDLNQHNASTTVRRRRPGILGKTVNYRHQYSSALADSGEIIVSSQETFEVEIQSPSDYNPNRELKEHMASQKSEMAGDEPVNNIEERGSIAEMETRVESLLDELLNPNCTDLDGDGALSFLQDRLQIKPINLEKLYLPDFDGIRRNDVKASEEKVVRPRKALSDIHNTIKRVSSKTYVEKQQAVESFAHPWASPTPPKSPFSSISLFKRRILQTDSSIDPFSALNIDASCVEHFSSVDGIDKQPVSPHSESNQFDANNSGKTSVEKQQAVESSAHPRASPTPPKSPFSSISLFKKHILETDSSNGPFSALNIDASCVEHSSSVLPHSESNQLDANNSAPSGFSGKELNFSSMFQSLICDEEGSNMVSGELVKENLVCPVDRPMDENSRRFDTSTNIRSNGGDGDLRYNTEDTNMVTRELVREDSASLLERPMDVNLSRLLTDIDSTAKGSDGDLNDNMQVEDVLQEAVASEQADLGVEGLTMETLDLSGSKLDQSGPSADEQHAADEPSETTNVSVEQNELEPSRILLKELSKPQTPPRNRRKRKELSRRQSLADAGTLWKSGVRRSTRIRMRPLEYWKGERFLYGRIHESLTTVIGLKYVSPEKDNGKPTIKVRSYVSDEYKDLVEQAALH